MAKSSIVNWDGVYEAIVGCDLEVFMKSFLVKKSFLDKNQLYDQVKKLIQMFDKKDFWKDFLGP